MAPSVSGPWVDVNCVPAFLSLSSAITLWENRCFPRLRNDRTNCCNNIALPFYPGPLSVIKHTCAMSFAHVVMQLPRHCFLPLTKLPQAHHLSQWKCEIYFQVTSGGDHKVISCHGDASWGNWGTEQREERGWVPLHLHLNSSPVVLHSVLLCF